MIEPDFYLASTEGYGMEEPRRCWRIRRLATANRDDLLLIKINPPLLGQKYGLGDNDINFVVVATRHQGGSLFPINQWPVYVHVAILLMDYSTIVGILQDDQIKPIAWAELYLTEEDAILKRM